MTSIRREKGSVWVEGERFDRVVIAAHPDQALAMLDDPRLDELRLLGSFGYSTNQTVLHTDSSLLPHAAGARASWNYLLDACTSSPPEVQVTYHLNRLHALHELEQYCVTLNQTDRIAESRRLRTITYQHPVYTLASLRAQRELAGLNGIAGTYYCGAYHGWGFHEDGCLSGLRAATALGGSLVSESCLYQGHVMHERRGEVRHVFRHGVYMWMVDLDGLSALDRRLRLFGNERPGVTSIRSRDHLGDPSRTISRTCTPTWRRTASVSRAAG